MVFFVESVATGGKAKDLVRVTGRSLRRGTELEPEQKAPGPCGARAPPRLRRGTETHQRAFLLSLGASTTLH